MAGYTDGDGDTLYVQDLEVNNGSLVNNQDGSYTFTPNANYNGKVDLTYLVVDNKGKYANGSNSFNLAPVNDAPEVTGQQTILPNGLEGSSYLINANEKRKHKNNIVQ